VGQRIGSNPYFLRPTALGAREEAVIAKARPLRALKALVDGDILAISCALPTDLPALGAGNRKGVEGEDAAASGSHARRTLPAANTTGGGRYRPERRTGRDAAPGRGPPAGPVLPSGRVRRSLLARDHCANA
jgi:hypothetical protein